MSLMILSHPGICFGSSCTNEKHVRGKIVTALEVPPGQGIITSNSLKLVELSEPEWFTCRFCFF